MYTLQLGKGRGPGGCRKGGSGNVGSPAQGDREEKGTRTMTPNHADKMQPGQHRTAGPGGGLGLLGQQHLDPAGVTLGCHSQPPLLGGLGQASPVTVTMGREAQGRSNKIRAH